MKWSLLNSQAKRLYCAEYFVCSIGGLNCCADYIYTFKLYIPGYGDAQKAKEYEMLKMKADSIEQSLIKKQELY